MLLDSVTLLAAAGAVVAVAGVTFILNTVLRRNDLYGRLWSVGFIAGILETISYLIWATSPHAWWAASIGNGALVLSLALMWSGCRAYNDRTRNYVWISFLASALVTLASAVEGENGGDWAGAEIMFSGIVVFSGLAAWESLRGALKRTINGRVLSIVFWIVALYYLLRTIVFLGAGENSTVFDDYFGTVTTTFIAIVLVIVAAICMSVLQPMPNALDGTARSRAGSLAIPGVVDIDQFGQQAGDWLARSRRDRESLVALEFSIDNLEHLDVALGRETTDAAISAVGRIACQSAPTASLVAYLNSGRFIILTPKPVFGSPAEIAGTLQTALVETPIDPDQGVRATASFGVATTDECGYSLEQLEGAARVALRDARARGAGSVVLAASASEKSDAGNTRTDA
jgi:diguanylate cyclase (GGDEF)-like protein